MEEPRLTLRAKPSQSVLGIVTAVLSAAGGCAAGIYALRANSPADRAEMVFVLVLCGFFASLGLWMIVFARRHMLAIDDQMLTTHDILRRRSLRLRDVYFAEWRTRPVGGSVVLRDGTQRLVIAFDTYRPSDRRMLADRIRAELPVTAQQTGWDDFVSRWLVATQASVETRRPFRIGLIGAFVVLATLIAVGVQAWAHRMPGSGVPAPTWQWIAGTAFGFSVPLIMILCLWWLYLLDTKKK